MKHFVLILFFSFYCFTLCSQSQDDPYLEIVEFQKTLNQNYENPETSILLKEDLDNFQGLEFYPIDLTYRVKASLKRALNEKPFLMPTTTERLPLYVKYGTVHFTIKNKDFVLDVFQNLEPKEGYEAYLFLPFTDLTSGDGTYGGGRYIDLITPEDEILILDFNKAYNPYCTYNANYSCPIPPAQNDLNIRIEAGVLDFKNE